MRPFEGIHSIHFVGIKGVAMTSLALWAKEAGFAVSGSDVADEFPTDALLKKANIPITIGFSPEHVTGDLVIYTGAHGGKDNIEVKTANQLGTVAYPHGKALGKVMEGKRQLSVAGCHGKTTTSAMIATILVSAGVDPSYAVGCGEVRGLGNPAHAGTGGYFVAEADEYVTDPGHDQTPRFLWQHPEILVVTNIDYDHPDVYSTMESMQQAYLLLAHQLQGKKVCISCSDDHNSDILRKNSLVTHVSFGYSNQATVKIKRVTTAAAGNTFLLMDQGKQRGPFTVKIPGAQNILNATAAILAAEQVGITDLEITQGLVKFLGAKRRFEYVGLKKGATIIDDYAHHPTEIAATVSAAREWYPNSRLIAVFQPHTYTRTKRLLNEFAAALQGCDEVITVPIYASARESVDTEISSEILAGKIQQYCPATVSVPSYDILASTLLKKLNNNDIVLFLGAGDIGLWSKKFMNE